MAASIFISYAHEDHERADQLAARLDAAGYSVWWDRKIRGGHAFDEVIEAAITAAKLVVVLWSHTSIHSNWVRAEATLAVDDNKLFPVKIDEVRPPLRFIQVQTADLTGWHGDADTPALTGFLADVAAHLGEPDQSPASPAGEDRAAAVDRPVAAPQASAFVAHHRAARFSQVKIGVVLSAVLAIAGLSAVDYVATRPAPPAQPIATASILAPRDPPAPAVTPSSLPAKGPPDTPAPPAPPVSRQIGQPVVFDRGKVTFSPAALSIIERQIVYLKDNPAIAVTIEGYSLDGEGLHDTLQALAELRALQVRRTLIQGGIDGGRLTVVSHGGDTPSGTADTQDPRVVLNRR